MKHLVRLSISLFFLLAFFSTITFAQITSIEKIKANPNNYEGNEVEISGLITQYVKGKGTTNYYLIKEDFGSIIRVNTSEPAPVTNKKYNVKGIVYIDANTNTPFISEKSKVLLEADVKEPTDVKSEVVKLPDGETKSEGKSGGEEKSANDNFLIYSLIALLVLLIATFLYFQFRKKTPEIETYTPTASQPQQVSPSYPMQEQAPVYSSDSDFKTIKIVTSSPKTLKFIPGKLIITDGVDKGKEFRIAGYPTQEGFIVSIGRKDVQGDRAYAHIQLKEKTVSREQAELLFRDNKLFIKNLSNTNLTQLNGVELQFGQIAEITPNSKIRTGEVEFQYIL